MSCRFRHLVFGENPNNDVWQAKKYDVLGVTVMFCDPRNCAVYRIPIGLAQTKEHVVEGSD